MTERYGTKFTRRLFLALAVPFAMACASSGGSAGSDSETGGNRDLITEAEIASLPPGDAFQAVQRLRPRWLQRRGNSPTAQVRIDGRLSSDGLDALRTVRGSEIAEIRFIDSRDATTRFGTGFSGGLIEVTTKG